jgi:hypothetical protein
MAYLGIVIEQSLKDPGGMAQFLILSTRRGKAWTFHLVAVPEEQIDQQVSVLQANMVTADYWYAHFFRGEELVIVYRDAVFRVSAHPDTWADAVAHGLRNGIPEEQLDFTPRSLSAVNAFFGTVLQ